MLIRFVRKSTHPELSARDMCLDGTQLAERIRVELCELIARLNLLSVQVPMPICIFYQIEGQSFTIWCNISLANPEALFERVLVSNSKNNKYNVSSERGNFVVPESIVSRNDRLLNNIKVPDEFVCALLGQVMTTPVKLPSGMVVESAAIRRHLKTSPTDPYTRKPLEEKDLIVDTSLMRNISTFIFEQLTSDLVQKINDHLQITSVHEQGYMTHHANPYGEDAQSLDCPSVYSFMSSGSTSTTTNQNGRVISQIRREFDVKLMNYPHPDKTRKALMDYYVAVTGSRNTEKATAILMCFPTEARKYFLEVQKRLGINIETPESAPQRPFSHNDSFFGEPHVEDITSIRPLM